MARARIGKRSRQLLVFTHVVVSVGWMGAGLANVVLAMSAGDTDDGDTRQVSYQLIHRIDAVLVIPGAFTALGSGLLLGVLTRGA